ncbi:MAG: arginine--tRNA ligase [Fulvivirga sp.]|uniref:arginine--tRNA ligase n=1 Tax=Fulvivirga sp. TaxID=1931237 RepID=UPI0032ECDC9E
MNIETTLVQSISKAFSELFSASLSESEISLQPTRKEFEGSHTFVCFPYARLSKKNPEETGKAIGEYLKSNCNIVAGFNVVKGFLNIELSDATWLAVFKDIHGAENFGFFPSNGKEVMVEYSSPNTNKPLHLGHLRNNFLGWSVAEILKANGNKVHKVQIINDRGIHICKSMIAWLEYGNGETPESTGKKGDKLVGDYYVKFDQEYKKQIAELVDGGMPKEEAEKQAPIFKKAQDLLLKWERRNPETYKLWETMNGWVYSGFEATYKQMGVDFDKLYYESDTYLLGKDQAQEGVDKGIFFKKDDGSVWVDLTEDGLDEKLILRADGTSVYMTQDIGTAILRFKDFPNISKQIYTVGNEQEYHFKVLFLILDKLGYEWAKECYHLSYGMVDLPSGKMKSREGTVVDADDLMQEMMTTAKEHTEELGKVDDFTEEQAEELYNTLGLGALKYFLLKVDPKKRMLFDPQESIQFQGNTAPFIQYTHARISAILRKANQLGVVPTAADFDLDKGLQSSERNLIFLLNDYPEKIKEAGDHYSPDTIANYVYELAKEYNRFYQEISIFNEQNEAAFKFRIALSKVVAETIQKAMGLLGITVPERM